MIDFIRRWGGQRSGISQLQIVGWVGIGRSKFYDWRARYGKANEHHAWIPRDHWIEDWERQRTARLPTAIPKMYKQSSAPFASTFSAESR